MKSTLDKNTYWRPSEDGIDLVVVCDGDNNRATLAAYGSAFPMKAAEVARLLNKAFDLGMAAKALELKSVLGCK